MRIILAFIVSLRAAYGALDFTVASSQGITTLSSSVATVPITMAIWAYRNFTGIGTAIGIGTDDEPVLTILTNTGERWGFAADSSGGALLLPFVSKDSTYRNRWVHLCVVVASTTSRKLYIDGVEELSSSTSLASSSVSRIYISGRWYLGANADFWPAPLSHAAIWTNALTADQVLSLAQGAAPNTVSPQTQVFYAPLSNIGPGGGSGTAVNTYGPQLLLTNTVSKSTTQPRIYR